MQSAIDIRVLATGQRLDVYNDATIEMNSGGFSILDVSVKTKNYTNSFKLPASPTNQIAFSFANNLKVTYRPVLDVIVSKGLYQQIGKLKIVTSNDKDLNCSFTEEVNPIFNLSLNTVLADIFGFFTVTSTIDYTDLTTKWLASDVISLIDFSYKNNDSLALDEQPVFIKLSYLFDIISSFYNYTISSVGFDFENDYLYLRDWKFGATDDWVIGDPSHSYSLYVESKGTTLDIDKTIAKIFNAVSDMYFADWQIVGSSIIFSKIESAPTQVLDGFTNIVKNNIPPEIPLTQYIDYELHSSNPAHFGGDVITGSGTQVKTRTISLYVPEVGSGWYKVKATDGNTKIIIGTKGATSFFDYRFTDPQGVQDLISNNGNLFAITSLSGVYSDILDPIYYDAFTIECNLYLNPTDASYLMNNKRFSSIQLGGNYRVDSMAYNLTTGQSKLKLIRL